jgi:hypothetical protein
MEPLTSRSQLLDKTQTCSDEFIVAEIARIEQKITEIRDELYKFYEWRSKEEKKTGHVIACDDSEFSVADIRKLEHHKSLWNIEQKHRTQRAFMKKVTTFPEEVTINWGDLYFVSACHSLADMARDLHKNKGIPVEALLEDIMGSIRKYMDQNPSWVDEHIQIEREAAIARIAAWKDEEEEANG